MAFTSFVFVAFFFVVYTTYWLLRARFRWQNAMLLVASYVFYGYWDWRFCLLLLLSSLVDYVIGRQMHASEDPRRRKLLLLVSLGVNLGVLGFFKYFNFFAESFAPMFTALGMEPDAVTLNIILPVGISFYTFQTLSYTIDIYRRELKPVNNLLDFALFVSFFPQLVAGPIERARHLLPQVCSPRTIRADQVQAGLWLILWGYFKKTVVADNAAVIANQAFNNYTEQSGMGLALGALAFAVQIFCDFSAYSDIARGLSKLMGFDLMVNFRLPYFAVSPSDFWRRWHISLSTWLRDYLYIPLGGNRGGKLFVMRNLMITMLLGGLWHGAAWNFVLWGAFHGLILVIYRALPNGDGSSLRGPTRWVVRGGMMAVMFVLTLIGWVLFRATGVRDAAGNLVHTSMDQITFFFTNLTPTYTAQDLTNGYDLMFFVLPMLLINILQERSGDLLVVNRLPLIPRGLVWGLLLVAIIVFGVREPSEFIYFQF